MTQIAERIPVPALNPGRGGKMYLLALAFLLPALALQLWLPVRAAAAVAQETLLEDVNCRLKAWGGGAAQTGMTLKSLTPGRYQANLKLEYQGLFGLVTGQRQDRFHTEMIYRNGRLAPLVYREETRWRNKYRLKEYRFDYDKGRLELWTYHKGKGMLPKWQTDLHGKSIFDPLSAFYNFRLGGLGPRQEGETIKVAGIPYPHPEEIVIQVGPKTHEGRKVMISFVNQAYKDKQGEICVFFDEKWSPVHAWTKVLSFGKVVGEILPGGKSLSGGLQEMAATAETKAPKN
jgi:hypothetical protein